MTNPDRRMTNPEIKVRDNGPYRVSGPARLTDADGAVCLELSAGETVALCRCGDSQTKPFCDGTHHAKGFDSCVRADAEGLDWAGFKRS